MEAECIKTEVNLIALFLLRRTINFSAPALAHLTDDQFVASDEAQNRACALVKQVKVQPTVREPADTIFQFSFLGAELFEFCRQSAFLDPGVAVGRKAMVPLQPGMDKQGNTPRKEKIRRRKGELLPVPSDQDTARYLGVGAWCTASGEDTTRGPDCCEAGFAQPVSCRRR